MKKLIKKVLFYSQRLVKSYKVRGVITKIQTKIKGKIDIPNTNSSKLIDSSKKNILLNSFQENGYLEMSKKLDDRIIDNIKNTVSNFSLFDPFNRHYGEFSMEQIPEKTHVANFNRKDLLTIPEILDLANDPGILDLVQDYLGCKPTISNINMWWSIAGKDKAEDAQLFHRDVDDIKFCKLFVYLTDVGIMDGPHTYVQSSSNSNKLTKIRRYEDSEIINAFGKESIMKFSRPKGSCFLVDTYGFHKGLLPINNDRLLLQIQYSINPIGIENYQPIDIPNSYNNYVNRLLLK